LFTQKYRTAANIAEFDDDIHINRLKEVIPKEMRPTLAAITQLQGLPTKWQEYLDLIVTVHKSLNPEKSRMIMFGQTSSSSQREPDAKDVDATSKSQKKTQKGKGKAKAQANNAVTVPCKFCVDRGNQRAAATHEQKDCRMKKAAQDSQQKAAPPAQRSNAFASGSNNTQNYNKNTNGNNQYQPKRAIGNGKPTQGGLRARLMKLLDTEFADDDAPSDDEALSVNSARIEEIFSSAARSSDSEDDEAEEGNSRPAGPKNKRKKVTRRIDTKSDFYPGM
jgi:hypothetical protein